jgi:hypothetical protein
MHYTITDDDAGPDNDAANRRIAMDFISELKQRKASQGNAPTEHGQPGKILNSDDGDNQDDGRVVFKKPHPVSPAKAGVGRRCTLCSRR